MNYNEALEYIHSVEWLGSRPGLSRTEELLEKLGNPEKDMKFVHVAGTNGKGSTCSMCESVLRAAGYKVGLYTSPYIVRFNERMCINGEPISDSELAELVEIIKPIADNMSDKPTEFEIITALAFLYYKRHACDIVVLEVGMGGRLDPTNIIRPIACAITAIGLDHMGFLGDTLEEIAGEKAGIIKADTPVVCYPAQESVRRVFAEAAAVKHAPLIQLDENAILHAEGDMYGSTVSYQLNENWQNLRINLPGQYQQRNAMTVLALVEELRKQGHAIPEEAVRKGLAETIWPARLEWAGRVLIDGAHNPQGVAALVDYVDAYLADKRRVLLSGVLADKLQPEMLGQMVHIARDIVTVTPDTPRAMSAEDYAAHLNAQGGCATAAATLGEGLRRALDLAGEDGVVIAAGSLYFAGSLRTELNLNWQ